MANNTVRRINIIGHQNPDTDSICSALAYAWLKNRGSLTPHRSGYAVCEGGLFPGADGPGHFRRVRGLFRGGGGGEETSFAYSIATAVRVPDTSAATTRDAYSTVTPGASILRTFTPRNRSISPISRRNRSIRPVRAVSSGVPTA